MDIPENIERAANAAFMDAWDIGHCGPVARAILAERQRCADIARSEGEGYRDHNIPQAAMGAFQVAKAIKAGL